MAENVAKKSEGETAAPIGDYAVIKSGGKQYRVSPGQKILVEKLEGAIGDSVTFGEVLLVKSGADALKVGAPFLSGTSVKAKIVAQEKDKKVITYKKRRRKGYTKKQGHRQARTRVVIETIA